MSSFFSAIRRPPRSTLFPSPALFRSISTLMPASASALNIRNPTPVRLRMPTPFRSEEHTSEVQTRGPISYVVFFFSDTATPEIYPLSLPGALPIYLDIDAGFGQRLEHPQSDARVAADADSLDAEKCENRGGFHFVAQLGRPVFAYF